MIAVMTKYAPKFLKAGVLPKLLLVCFITVVMHDTFRVLWTIDKFRNEYREAAQTRTMEEVEIAGSVIARWHDFESAGTLSRAEAQASALAELGQLQYPSEDGLGHFWVTDLQPVLLADAARPDLVDTNVGSVPAWPTFTAARETAHRPAVDSGIRDNHLTRE